MHDQNAMQLSVLPQASREQWADQLYAIPYQQGDILLCELQGQAHDPLPFSLPGSGRETLWLGLQFQGSLQVGAENTSLSGSFFSFRTSSAAAALMPTVTAGKQHVLLLGVQGESLQQLQAELPILRGRLATGATGLKNQPKLGHAERQLLLQFAKANFGPFSSQHHIAVLCSKLFASYAARLEKQAEDTSLDQIYQQALDYILAHYQEKDLNRTRIAAALACSARSLSRAFEGRPHGLYASIITVRLYKGRELLQKHPKLSVATIAHRLHFSATNFATLYKKLFQHTPLEERKLYKKR